MEGGARFVFELRRFLNISILLFTKFDHLEPLNFGVFDEYFRLGSTTKDSWSLFGFFTSKRLISDTSSSLSKWLTEIAEYFRLLIAESSERSLFAFELYKYLSDGTRSFNLQVGLSKVSYLNEFTPKSFTSENSHTYTSFTYAYTWYYIKSPILDQLRIKLDLK